MISYTDTYCYDKLIYIFIIKHYLDWTNYRDHALFWDWEICVDRFVLFDIWINLYV